MALIAFISSKVGNLCSNLSMRPKTTKVHGCVTTSTTTDPKNNTQTLYQCVPFMHHECAPIKHECDILHT